MANWGHKESREAFEKLENAFLEPLKRLIDAELAKMGGWPAMDHCDGCNGWFPTGQKCSICAPSGMVKCPYRLAGDDKHSKKCSACKGSGWVEALE